jgi:hypothetical protein
MVVSTDLPLLEAALVLLPVAYKQLPHLELKNTSLQPAPVLIFLHILVTSKLSQRLLLLLLLLKLKKLFSQHHPLPSQMG